MNDLPWVYLDGNLVDPTTIDPIKHNFVGMFRPPVNPTAGCTTDFLCPCGTMLRYVPEGAQHYQNGCFDRASYRTN